MTVNANYIYISQAELGVMLQVLSNLSFYQLLKTKAYVLLHTLCVSSAVITRTGLVLGDKLTEQTLAGTLLVL